MTVPIRKRVPTAAERRRVTPLPPEPETAPPEAAEPPQPSREVVPTTPKLPAAATDSIQAYLDEIAPAAMVGRMIRFNGKDGRYITHDDGQGIGDGQRFIFLAEETLIGFVKFNPEGPPDRVMGLLFGGFRMPDPATLPDRDKSLWDTGLDGKPADPWQHHIYLVLQSTETQELFSLVAASKTSRTAAGNLLKHYERTKKRKPDELPIVELRVGGFNHPDTRVGWVHTPVFTVVGSAKSAGVPKSTKEELDDAIPF
jgi:hypothetical protein